MGKNWVIWGMEVRDETSHSMQWWLYIHSRFVAKLSFPGFGSRSLVETLAINYSLHFLKNIALNPVSFILTGIKCASLFHLLLRQCTWNMFSNFEPTGCNLLYLSADLWKGGAGMCSKCTVNKYLKILSSHSESFFFFWLRVHLNVVLMSVCLHVNGVLAY